MGVFTVASSIGALFGGKMGDVLSVRFPNAGRIILSQISSGSAIPLAWILLLGLPDDPNTAFKRGLILFIMGLFITWNAAGTNNPTFAEIVPEKSRMSIYAMDRSFESVLASFAPPVVGLLSRHAFGYKPIPQWSSLSVEVETDRENVASLAKAMYTEIAILMAICCFIYTFLYRTYPRDRDRAKMNALIESEMEQLKSENLPTGGDYSQVQVYEKETVIDIDYGAEEDGLEVDESDEKTLLTRKRDRDRELKMKSETLTLVLVNLAGIMERADESLLPGVYKEVGAALHTDPTGLGSLTLFRSIVQSVCYPLAMYLSVRHNHTHVIALGAFLWAAATFLVGFSSTFFQVAVSRGLNGIGLAMVTPAIQSLVADSIEDHNRCVAFGWLGLIQFWVAFYQFFWLPLYSWVLLVGEFHSISLQL
ncbi:hypothetical protein C5167_011277 [Papaver somniferum]|uniref:Major facilitator superfamily (MFS) profile domain-containing protein n=1 Tax=Papaver somniferum TaxID=3469 RepID=A0A4Y7K5U3_PAPSO|nr:hypothetical protein C5167_011277 [Papaver somniferum]